MKTKDLLRALETSIETLIHLIPTSKEKDEKVEKVAQVVSTLSTHIEQLRSDVLLCIYELRLELPVELNHRLDNIKNVITEKGE